MLDAIIIGAGISGLTIASRLTKAGKKVRLIEKAPAAGGTMQTLREDGYTIDFGPNTLVLNNPKIMEMIRYAGLEGEVCYAGQLAKNRFVVKNGTLVPLPQGLLSFLRTPLFSTRAKLRLLGEPFIGKGSDKESVAQFVTRRLGSEFLEYAVDPFISGVYAGDPHKLSVKWAVPKIYALQTKYGSLMRGAVLGLRERRRLKRTQGEEARTKARICNFKQGIAVFPSALAAKLGDTLSVDTQVHSIAKIQGGFSLKCDTPSGPVDWQTRSLTFCVPAYELDNLLQLVDPAHPGTLGTIPYAPVAQVFLGFKRELIGHDLNGFGLLLPDAERGQILGALMNASMFSGRAPEGHTALTVFLGGARHPELLEWDEEQLVDVSQKELSRFMPISGKASFVRVRKWNRAIPQYQLDYPEYAATLEAFERRNRGIYLSGNWRGGISVGDCMNQSYATADEITAFTATSA